MDVDNPDGPIYCAEQIKIPPELPGILKQYTKAAIRTQPNDILEWSLAYFKALSTNDVPPVKKRLELVPLESKEALTKGGLAMLHTQLGDKETVALDELQEKWKAAGFSKQQLEDLIGLGNFGENVEWLNFLSLACSALDNNICAAMTCVCEILSPDPEGGPARIPLDLFITLYTFLAKVDGEISNERIKAVQTYLKADCEKQGDQVGPANFTHIDCPKLGGE